MLIVSFHTSNLKVICYDITRITVNISAQTSESFMQFVNGSYRLLILK